MKIFTLLLLLPFLGLAQNTVTITGFTPALKNGTSITLDKLLPGTMLKIVPIGETKIKSHRFRFLIKAMSAEMYSINAGKNYLTVFLQPGNVTLHFKDSTLKKVKIEGNNTALEYDDYQEYDKATTLSTEYFRSRRDYDEYNSKEKVDSIISNRKMRKRDSLAILYRQECANSNLIWIKAHPNSYINPDLLYRIVNFLPDDKVREVFNAMPARVKTNSWAKELKYRIDNLFVGCTAPEFSQADTLGKLINLSSMRGKYVLVDFWASWCGPCRAANPQLVEVYNSYKNKNFSMLGISLDHNGAAWRKAINTDKLTWLNISDLKAWDNVVSSAYRLSEIPQNFLLDPKGRIVAKDVYGNNLRVVLDKFLQ